MSSYKFHEHAAELIRGVHHERVSVTGEIEYQSIVTDKIDGRAERPLDVIRVAPSRLRHNRKPRPNRTFSLGVAFPKLLQGPASDHPHGKK
jgi:hypothetical protein